MTRTTVPIQVTLENIPGDIAVDSSSGEELPSVRNDSATNSAVRIGKTRLIKTSLVRPPVRPAVHSLARSRRALSRHRMASFSTPPPTTESGPYPTNRMASSSFCSTWSPRRTGLWRISSRTQRFYCVHMFYDLRSVFMLIQLQNIGCDEVARTIFETHSSKPCVPARSRVLRAVCTSCRIYMYCCGFVFFVLFATHLFLRAPQRSVQSPPTARPYTLVAVRARSVHAGARGGRSDLFFSAGVDKRFPWFHYLRPYFVRTCREFVVRLCTDEHTT